MHVASAPGNPQAAAAGKLDSVEWRPQASELDRFRCRPLAQLHCSVMLQAPVLKALYVDLAGRDNRLIMSHLSLMSSSCST